MSKPGIKITDLYYQEPLNPQKESGLRNKNTHQWVGYRDKTLGWMIHVDSRKQTVARLIWEICHGTEPPPIIYRRDGDLFNNSLDNLTNNRLESSRVKYSSIPLEKRLRMGKLSLWFNEKLLAYCLMPRREYEGVTFRITEHKERPPEQYWISVVEHNKARYQVRSKQILYVAGMRQSLIEREGLDRPYTKLTLLERFKYRLIKRLIER